MSMDFNEFSKAIQENKIAMECKKVKDEEGNVFIDTTEMEYDPDYVNKLSEEELNEFGRIAGIVLSLAEQMGMMFKNEFYEKVEKYIFEEEE